MRVARAIGPYNPRRYGRPWIAKVTSWPVGGKPKLEFGFYVGDECGGEVEISAEPGDVLRIGQRDHRGNNSTDCWYVLLPSGRLDRVSAAQARGAYLQQANNAE